MLAFPNVRFRAWAVFGYWDEEISEFTAAVAFSAGNARFSVFLDLFAFFQLFVSRYFLGTQANEASFNSSVGTRSIYFRCVALHVFACCLARASASVLLQPPVGRSPVKESQTRLLRHAFTAAQSRKISAQTGKTFVRARHQILAIETNSY
jgi:hypothetical protein